MKTKTDTQAMFHATWVSTVRPHGSIAVSKIPTDDYLS